MNQLLICTFLRALRNYKSSSRPRQDIIINALFSCAIDEILDPPATEQDASKYFKGHLDVPNDHILQKVKERSFSHPKEYSNRFSQNIIGKIINSSKVSDLGKVIAFIILEDDSIDSSIEIDCVSGITKKDLPNIKYNEQFLAGVFLFLLVFRGNMNKGYNSLAKTITPEFCESALLSINMSIANSTKPTISANAKRFIHKYKKSIDLSPLCQIASLFDYQYELVNPMYIDYCELDETDQQAIMKTYDYPIITVNSPYDFYKAIDLFVDDVETNNLASDGKSYCIKQYLDSSLEFGEYIPKMKYYDIYPCMKSARFNRETITLDQFIDDYLFIQEHQLNDSLPKPLDWIWDYFNFAFCSKKQIAFMLNFFIINSCASLRRYSKNLSLNPHLSMSYNVSSFSNLEDLYFLALLKLYEMYL